MRGLWSAWIGLLAREETGEALALWRVSMGLVLIGSLGLPWVSGVVPVIWLPIEHGGYLKLEHSSWMMNLLGGPTPDRVHGALILGIASGLALVLGIWSRVAAFVGLQAFLALAWINPHAGGSYDVLITNALWLLVLARSDATWSVQARIRKGCWSTKTLVSSWPRYLVILQLVIMYASSGWHKLSIYWVPGGDFSALYYIMQQPSWQRMDMRWLAQGYPLTQLSTAFVWIFETVGAPLLLVFYISRSSSMDSFAPARMLRRIPYRKLFILSGLIMHIMIWLAMDVGPFSWASMAYYTALLRPDELAAIGTRVRTHTTIPTMETP